MKNKIIKYTSRGKKSSLFVHECQHCNKWGAFGYNVNIKRQQSGKWYCQEHKPQEGEQNELFRT